MPDTCCRACGAELSVSACKSCGRPLLKGCSKCLMIPDSGMHVECVERPAA